MITCEQLRRVLGRVLQGEYEPEALTHLEACPRCRLVVDELNVISRSAARLPSYAPPPALWRRIRQAAELEGLLTPAWPARLRTAFGLRQPLAVSPAFAVALMVVLSVAVWLVGYPPLDVSLPPEALPSPVEVAHSELVSTPSYAERYALHLARIEKVMLEDIAPANAELSSVAQQSLQTLDRFINQCQARLVSYPEDNFTREELSRLYQQKTTLLQTMLDPDWRTSVR